MSDDPQLIKWASTFDALGNPTRLGILIVIYGSDIARKRGCCLTFSEIKSIMRITSDSALDYHLKRLLDTTLIEKMPTSDSPTSKLYPLYRTTDKAKAFLEEVGLAEATRAFMKGLLATPPTS